MQAAIKYYNAIDGALPPYRNKLDIGKDDLLNNYKKMLLDKDISVKVYLKYVSALYNLAKTRCSELSQINEDSESDDTISDSESDNGSD